MKKIKNFLICTSLVSVMACSTPTSTPTSTSTDDGSDKELREQALSLLKPLKNDTAGQGGLLAAQISLGRTLFFDKRISASGEMGCGQCHQPEFYGASATAPSQAGSALQYNIPTVLNASLNFANNWYGDQTSIENQSLASLESKAGLGHSSKANAVAKIKAIPEYSPLFAAAFPDKANPVTPKNLAAALGAYQRTLITPAPLDEYLDGNDKAISPDAKIGLKRFMDIGCVACHNGIGIGGGGYQKFGIWEDYWPVTKSETIDKGRFNLTKDENDLYVFRVANLRNVTKTAPYFHDGSVNDLPDAVRIMGKIQLRKTLSDEDVKYVGAFLNTLTGKLPKSFSPPQ